MEAKIKELEEQLAAAHLHMSNGPESLEETDGRDPHSESNKMRRPYGDGSGCGCLAIDREGVSRYHGDTAQSDVSRPCLFSRSETDVFQYLSGLIPV